MTDIVLYINTTMLTNFMNYHTTGD